MSHQPEQPLSVDEVAALPEGAHVVVTWSGGNGPHRYVIAVREGGERYVWDGTTEALRWYNPLSFVGPERYHTRVWLDPEAAACTCGHSAREHLPQGGCLGGPLDDPTCGCTADQVVDTTEPTAEAQQDDEREALRRELVEALEINDPPQYWNPEELAELIDAVLEVTWPERERAVVTALVSRLSGDTETLRDALRIHHPIMRSETGPFSGCRCGQVQLGQDVIAHVVAHLSAALGARHRPTPGRLLPRDDPRVVAAIGASRCLGTFDWRDIAEIVNAVLEADDQLAAVTDV